MKTLTIRQPWASLIALGAKTIETRSWTTNYRGPIAIHAGTSLAGFGRAGRRGIPNLTTIGDYETERDQSGLLLRSVNRQMQPYRLPLGAIIATATLTNCLPIVTVHTRTFGQRYLETARLAGHLIRNSPPDDFPDCQRFTDHTDQLPYGDFTPGRWGWMLTDITPIDPIPAKGKQGLWEATL